jgi:hypothetical protein
MWDILLTIASAIFISSLLPTLFDSRSYVPRQTSGLSVVGLIFVCTGLAGEGLVISAGFTVVAIVLGSSSSPSAARPTPPISPVLGSWFWVLGVPRCH